MAVGKILIDTIRHDTSRGPSAIAELLVVMSSACSGCRGAMAAVHAAETACDRHDIRPTASTDTSLELALPPPAILRDATRLIFHYNYI